MSENEQYSLIVQFIKSLYPDQNPVPLHAPVFLGNEKAYLNDCIDSTFVSYVGKYVAKFEEMTAEFTGAKYAVAVVNGTAALQIALKIAGVEYSDEVLTQPLTFVATANAIVHNGAKPVFIDVDEDTMGLSPEKLEEWLEDNATFNSVTKATLNKRTGNRISAIVPMHTFGFPCRINEIVEIAEKFGVPVIEDSAESLGSYVQGKHTGTFGLAGILSYNGNKTITTGGGGMIITDNEEFARTAKHITTTAKVPHKWEYIHDQVGYNFRLTNVLAALGVAQMEKIDEILLNKRNTAFKYKAFFHDLDIKFISESENTKANYWLNCIKVEDRSQRDQFLERTNSNGVMTRPIWRLMNKLQMFESCLTSDLTNSQFLEDRIVNIPSGFRQSSTLNI
ncbi:MAG: LegC family aminotransferase [Ignavibacteriaceae bacterium]|nr:LegC family aminotransferase [Ignavibacteriaceae bacterium]